MNNTITPLNIIEPSIAVQRTDKECSASEINRKNKKSKTPCTFAITRAISDEKLLPNKRPIFFARAKKPLQVCSKIVR